MFKLITCCTIFLSLLFATSVLAQTVPPAPTNLAVEQMMNYAKLTWDSSTGARGYKVYKALDSLHFNPIAIIRMPMFVDQYVPPGHVYRYYVTAFNIYGESAPSNDVIFVPNAPPPNRVWGVIRGNIIDDSTTLPIPEVRVRFYKPNGFLYFHETRTDNLGNYSIRLDTGKYFIYVSKWAYVPEWYDNELNFLDATPVIVADSDTSLASFGLTPRPSPPPVEFVSVSGTVTDSVTGDPIRGAFVVIMRPNRMINMMQNHDGSMFGNRNEMFFLPEFGTLLGVLRVVTTDSNGNYTINVPDSLRYIMLAYKPGYIPEFYKDKRTPFDADRLFITGDTTGINFDLIINPNVQNSVSGTVKNADGDGVLSKVVLFHATPRGLYPVRVAITDTLGNYLFRYLYKGMYFAKAVPFAFYVPAWYDKDTCGTMFWLNADHFAVDSVTTGIDICVKPISPGGLASIGGTIRETTRGDVLLGVTVFAVSSSSNDIVGYDITEEDGKFEIQNLAPGSYSIVFDKEGYNSSSLLGINVDASNDYAVNNADINLNVVLAVKEQNSTLPTTYVLGQNYPNPFNPTTEIDFSLPTTSHVSISIYNILGQLVTTLINQDVAAGNYSISWNGVDVNDLSVGSGVYFYKINANALNNSTMFSSVRKMVLLK